MATSGTKSSRNQTKEERDEEVECRICLQQYNKPKLLPCFHTFCLECLKKYCDEADDSIIPCPLCRSEFSVPQDDVDKLPDNELITRLIFLKRHHDDESTPSKCDPCKGIEDDINAESFCMDCRQSLKYTKQHNVVSIEEKPTDYEMQRLMSNFCKIHDNKELELYCCDCRKLVCVVCHVTDHNKHVCRIPHDIAKEKKDLSENYRKGLEKFLIIGDERKQRLIKIKQDAQQQIMSTESSIRKSVDTIRNLLDDCEKEMLQELATIKKNIFKELATSMDSEDLLYTTLDSFLTYSRLVMDRGTDCEIIRASDDLHKRAEKLIKDQKKKNSFVFSKVQLKFIESITRSSQDMMRLIGKIVYQPSGRNAFIVYILV
jgi:hypothetical protein